MIILSCHYFYYYYKKLISSSLENYKYVDVNLIKESFCHQANQLLQQSTISSCFKRLYSPNFSPFNSCVLCRFFLHIQDHVISRRKLQLQLKCWSFRFAPRLQKEVVNFKGVHFSCRLSSNLPFFYFWCLMVNMGIFSLSSW